MAENLLTMLAFDDSKETLQDAQNVPAKTAILKNYLNQTRNSQVNKSVLLIGGGIVGLISAYYLAHLGFKVHIVEAESFGAAASGRNAGAVMTFGREMKELPYCLTALELWRDLTNKGMNTHFDKNGQIMFARTAVEQAKLREAYTFYKSAGVDVTLLNHEQMKQYAPLLNEEVQLGLLCKDDGTAYPFTTVQSLIQEIRKLGGKVTSHTKVTKVNVANAKIVNVETSKSVLESDYYIFTTGPWTAELFKQFEEHIPIRPRRSQIFATEIIREKVLKTFCTGNGIYFRQSHAGNIIFGGGGPWEIDGFKVENTVEAIELQAKRLLQLFPKLQTKKLLRSFAGTVELTPDHFPIMSKSLVLSNVFISAGYNGHGFGLSAVFGKFLSAYIYDLALELEIDASVTQMIDELSLKRFENQLKSE